MTITPKPTQLSGAKFLANNRTALLADLPRVGKTGTALIAADLILAQKILVITTASGRGVWRAAAAEWSAINRRVQVLAGGDRLRDDTDICIVSWGGMAQAAVRAQLLRRKWDLLLPDEAHAAKAFTAKRTQALYGVISRDGEVLVDTQALTSVSARVWPLTGTPLPNCPLDVYPMMRALCSDRLGADEQRGWPDVTRLSAFTERYCKMRPMKVGRGPYAKRIDVFVEGRNLAELRGRLDGFFLRRTQQDVGILKPVYETMPFDADLPPELLSADARPILAAAERGDTRSLEMHLGPLRRLTGEIKAHLVADAIAEELHTAVDKIVLAYWHRDVGDILEEQLAGFGVVRLDGSTSAAGRSAAERAFLRDPKARVFLGQIQAAGEAIDLSSAKHLVFVETSLVPKDMLQMSLRVTNHTQIEQPLVRVATLAGSVDDALQQVLMRKWTAIREVLS
jgi:hypothetical protein